MIRAKLVQAISSLREAKEYGDQVKNEHRAVKRKQMQLNAHIKVCQNGRDGQSNIKGKQKRADQTHPVAKGLGEGCQGCQSSKYVAGKAYNEMQKDQKCEQGSYLHRKATLYCKNGRKYEV